MTIRRRIAPFALLALALITPSADAQDAAAQAAEDLKLIEGTWDVEGAEEGGRDVKEPAVLDQALVFAADGKYRVLFRDDTVESGTFVLDPKPSPRAVDLKIKEGADASKTQLGIYKLEGDSLTISFNKPGNTARPKDFKTEPNTGQFAFKLKRRAKS